MFQVGVINIDVFVHSNTTVYRELLEWFPGGT